MVSHGRGLPALVTLLSRHMASVFKYGGDEGKTDLSTYLEALLGPEAVLVHDRPSFGSPSPLQARAFHFIAG